MILGVEMNDPVKRLADELSPFEKKLLLGECSGSGSWMFDAGNRMVSMGLGTKDNGIIRLDTPLARELKTFLRAKSESKFPPGFSKPHPSSGGRVA
jgi:hypothetical protein